MHKDLFSQGSFELTATESYTAPPHSLASTAAASSGRMRRAALSLLLLAVISLVWLATAEWLTGMPQLPARLGSNWRHQLVLKSSSAPMLQPHIGKVVALIEGENGALDSFNALLTLHSARWLTQDVLRDMQLAQHQKLSHIVSSGMVSMQFADGSSAKIDVNASGLRLPPVFWLHALVSTLLVMTALTWVLTKAPQSHRSLALMTLCQAILVALDAVGAGLGSSVSARFLTLDLNLRAVAELTLVAAILQASSTHITAAPWARRLRSSTWIATAVLALLLTFNLLPNAWWWMQSGVQLTFTAALLMQHHSQRSQPHPWTALFKHFTLPAMLVWPLLTLAAAGDLDVPKETQALRELAPQIWTAALSMLFLALPFMLRSQRVAREIVFWSTMALGCLAGVLLWTAHRATSSLSVVWLNLLAAMVLAIISRWWLSHHVFERRSLRAAQLFDGLYRAIRMAGSKPKQAQLALTSLLSTIFSPLRVESLERSSPRSMILADGACLLIPIPNLQSDASEHPIQATSLILHGSQSGRRLFTHEDEHLADLLVEQIQRAVLFDKAIEQGRNEERIRLANDLHDDIGARLLTLMYKSATPEMEDYVRHTLKDLKTLTRGLSASNHSLSFACAEWKTDMAQRLSAVDCELQWTANWDDDHELNVVEWSAITRILRELVSNAIAHAQASIVRIELNLESDQLILRVQDNGKGKSPELWAHGLGLSGVRKRVKQLGGSVEWKSLPESGIVCLIKLTLGQ